MVAVWGVFAFGMISLVGGGLLVLRGIGRPTDVARNVLRREQDPEVGAEEG